MAKKFAVIGMGVFGSHLARALYQQGAEVLVMDEDMTRIDEIKHEVTHALCIDTTNEQALANAGVVEFDAVVVCMGEDFEAVVLTVATLQQLGVRRIVARARTKIHERILEHLGVSEIVLPSVEAAVRMSSSLLMESWLDSFDLSDDYTIVEMKAPERFIGQTLAVLDLRKRHDVSIITIRRHVSKKPLRRAFRRGASTIIGTPSPETVIERGDVLIVFGRAVNIQEMDAS